LKPEAPTEKIVQVLRRSLERGRSVEVDGLGVFRADSKHGYRFVPEARPRVFIAYVQEDLFLARKLCDALKASGCAPWLDKDQLLAGQNWPRAIERAIGISDAFVACFSRRSVVKRGQFQCELRYALDCARRRPLDTLFLIPLRFEPCEVPRRITDQTQYVDMFPDWERGMKRLVRSVLKAAGRYKPPTLARLPIAP
jgi:hypothetical protein